MRPYDDLLIDALLDHGFTVQEAENLISLQERVERERQEQARQHRTTPRRGKSSSPDAHERAE